MKKYFKISNYFNYLINKVNSFIKYQKTYSQTGEDLILNVLLNDKKNGFYIDIGANDPKRFNNTFLFYQKGWSGINIEPNKKKIDLFQRIRKKDLNLNLGIGTANNDLNFYMFEEDTLSTFSRGTADSYENMGHKILEIIKVKVLSLERVLDKYLSGRNIDFLSIDTEGNDLDVLKSNNWQKYRPHFLVIETLIYKKDGFGEKLNSVYDTYLSSCGYEKIAETYINTIYYDKHH